MRNYLLIALLCCIPGCLVPNPFDNVVNKPTSKIVEREVTSLDKDMAEALKDKTLEEHESLYKVFKGASEFSKNAQNLDIVKGVEVQKALTSVMKMYDVYNKFPIKSIMESKTRALNMPAGLLDTVATLKELEKKANTNITSSELDSAYVGFTDGTTVREILIKTYDDLANAVKYSAEHLKGK